MSVKTEWEMACPKCGSDEQIMIIATVRIQLMEDGTEGGHGGGGFEWDEHSPCTCDKCGHSGEVEDFEAEPPDSYEANQLVGD